LNGSPGGSFELRPELRPSSQAIESYASKQGAKVCIPSFFRRAPGICSAVRAAEHPSVMGVMLVSSYIKK
jgi:hypothetical protein